MNYLLNSIETSDAQLLTAVKAVRGDSTPNGKRENFELASAHLLPACPVTRHRLKKQAAVQIADVQATTGEAKPGISKSGVHL